jgi:Flp pilus assembly protein TadD
MARALYGWAMWESGRFSEIEGVMRDLVAREPTTAQWRCDLAWTYWSSGDSAAARVAALAAVAADSTFYEAFDVLGLIEADAGNIAAAEQAHARAIEVAGGDYWVRQMNEGVILAAKGDTAGVRRVLSELEGDPRYAQRALLASLLGLPDSMYALLDQAFETRDLDMLQVVNAMPYLYPRRSEPRFQQLLARVGIPVGQ